MNTIDRFREAFRERAEGIYLGTLQQIMRYVRGWSSVNVLAAIGAAVDVSGAGYLEVGCMNGRTLCGAMVGNGDRLFVGVDNFALSTSRDVLMGNVGNLHPGVKVHFYEMDYQEFFRTHAEQFRGQIGCYFYDADHSLTGQRDGMRLAIESGILADEVLIVVDDYSWPDTKWAVGEFLATWPGWVGLAEEDNWDHRGWWNGLVVLYREQVDAAGVRPEGVKNKR